MLAPCNNWALKTTNSSIVSESNSVIGEMLAYISLASKCKSENYLQMINSIPNYRSITFIFLSKDFLEYIISVLQTGSLLALYVY